MVTYFHPNPPIPLPESISIIGIRIYLLGSESINSQKGDSQTILSYFHSNLCRKSGKNLLESQVIYAEDV